MNKYNHLLSRIATAHNISQGKSESVEAYKARIIYSAIGESAYASLWDTMEDGKFVSIIHMKDRIKSLLQDYKDLYPELNGMLTFAPEELAEDIYQIYLRSGFIYHEPNRITAGKKTGVVCGNIQFTRGYSPGETQFMSGLGTYQYVSESSFLASVGDLFQIAHSSLSSQWQELSQNATWIVPRFESGAEYLNHAPQKIQGYWVNKLNKSGSVSICRTGMPGFHQYYLYRYDMKDKHILVSPIPQWNLEYPYGADNNTENHRQFTNACLAATEELPPTFYYPDGDIVKVKYSYLMPPSVMAMTNLYSWPESSVSLPQNFRRVFSSDVFEVIVNVLSPLGYSFVKE